MDTSLRKTHNWQGSTGHWVLQAKSRVTEHVVGTGHGELSLTVPPVFSAAKAVGDHCWQNYVR